MEMTKAGYFSLAKADRRKHKDGTYWARMRGRQTWVQVFWRR